MIRCATCDDLSLGLLDKFPLVAVGDTIIPLPGQLCGLNPLEKSEVALSAFFSTTTKYSNKMSAEFEHRRGEVNALHKDDNR